MNDYLFKFISVGDSGVGKSCLLHRLTSNDFQPTETTIGIEFGSSVVNIQGKTVKLQIWDTAGQESFKSVSRAYYRNAIGCLLVFDVTRRETFDHLESWLQDVTQHGNDDILIILVANKSDQLAKRQVSALEASAYAELNGLLYIEASAKTGSNVQEAFLQLSEKIFNSLNLRRIATQFSEDEIKRLENHGVRVGPRRPMVLVGREASNQSSCC